MEYDPVKDKMQAALKGSAWRRKLFFAALDRLFLRSRYVARELKRLQWNGFSPTEILDAGSGFGQYSIRMARTFPGAKITGLDVKADLVESGNQFARQAGFSNVSFTVGDLLNLEYKTQFDLALSVDVLEHIEDDRGVMANIARALKPGGLFILTTPYWPGTTEKNAADQPFVDEHVRPGYSLNEMREKLAGAGLELTYFTIAYGPWGNIAWKLLQQGPMSWLKGRIWLAPLVALYFCFAYPLAWLFMQMDMKTHNRNGGGILAVAKKPVSANLEGNQRNRDWQLWLGIAGDLTHQMGTPLSALLGWMELLPTTKDPTLALKEMNLSLVRLQAIAIRLAQVGAPGRFDNVSLRELIEETQTYFQKRIAQSSGIVIRTQVEGNPIARINRELLLWVLEGLVKNAVDAIDGKNGWIVLRVTEKNGKATLEVEDNGRGLNPEMLAQIFEPGFSSKPGGRGLGLPLARHIIENGHKGRLLIVKTEPGKGTIIRIEFEATPHG